MTTNELGFVSKTIEMLKAGEYDAVVHGVVNLGLRPGSEQTYKNKDTGAMETKVTAPAIFLRIIFELPNDIRSNDDLPHVIAKAIKVSAFIPKKAGAMESGFYKILKALGEAPTASNIFSYMGKEGLTKLGGRAVVLSVANQTSANGNEYAKITDIARLHAKVTPPIPVRPFFYFNPRDPDLEVFKNTLTYWTQKDIMEALDSDCFPAELHALWAKLQEERIAQQGGAMPALNTESIE